MCNHRGVDGIHDLGGMQGFGPVVVEPDEPVFHHAWEGRTFATVAGALGAANANTPQFRHAIERMDPAHYLTSGYYEHWLTGATTLLVEAGVLVHEELEARAGTFPLSRPVLVEAGDLDRVVPAPVARFEVGDPVRVRDTHFPGHARCPRYVRGHVGVIVALEPVVPVPELEAHRNEKVAEATYAVRFDARELWGDDADAKTCVHVDLYDEYLEAIERSPRG
ncbi:MAG: Nitrile hydratase [Actinomycetia bacterium]|nr:Nitrile hydratase [Actinomycetes bacterium]